MDGELDIALWGTTGSGKTWLVEAFYRKIQLMNEELRRIPNFFEFELIDLDTDRPVPTDKRPKQKGTEETKYQQYLFVRKGLGEGLRFDASSHCHRIALTDGQGSLMAKVGDQTLDDKKKQQQRATLEILKRSGYVMAIIEAGTDDSGTENTNHKAFSQALKDLRQLLKGQHRHIAMCLTKADQYGTGIEHIPDVKTLVLGRFNADVSDDIFKELTQFKKEDKHEVQFFSMSAAGYYEDDKGERKVNKNPTTKELEEADLWRPEGVEKPFFWLFDLLERAKLQGDNRIGPKLFDLLYKPVGIHRQARAAAYVSYPYLQAKIKMDVLASNKETGKPVPVKVQEDEIRVYRR